MAGNKLGRFQPKLWEEAASEGNLRAVLDKADIRGRKNRYIDTLHKQQLSRALMLKGNETVLDFGSGLGRISSWLAPQCTKVIGIDVTPAMIRKAEDTNIYSNVEYILYDGLNIPVDNEYFDRIISVYVLQHITDAEDFIKIIIEFYRTLRIGGKVCLIEQVSAEQTHEEGMPKDFNLRRKPLEYVDAFSQSGFYCTDWRLIRTSSAFTWLAEQSLFPPPIFPCLALAESLISRRRNLSYLTYADCLFVFTKKQGDSN